MSTTNLRPKSILLFTVAAIALGALTGANARERECQPAVNTEAEKPQDGINTRLMRKRADRWVIALNHVSSRELP